MRWFALQRKATRLTAVLLLSSGAETNYPDYAANLAPGGYNYVDGNTDTDDTYGTGTVLTGVMAAEPDNGGFVGVAPEAKVLEVKVLGPYGSLNVPVTAFCSIATDKKVYPAGMLSFVSVPIPTADDRFPGAGSASPTSSGDTRPFTGFLLDQDRGGAIRSAGRCDIYMGIGQHAEEISGHQVNPGGLYYLAVKIRQDKTATDEHR